MTVVTNTPKVKSLQRQSFKKGKKFKRYKKFKSSKTSRALNKKRVIALVPQKPYWQLPLPKETINYKNIVLLRKCITTEGKILPRRVSGLNAKQQRSMSKAIKNCKLIGLLPFISISK